MPGRVPEAKWIRGDNTINVKSVNEIPKVLAKPPTSPVKMHTKFASLTVLLSVLFTSQAVGAVPKAIDCSKVFCPATRCPLGKTAEVLPGACCATCVKCSGICPEFILLWLVFILPATFDLPFVAYLPESESHRGLVSSLCDSV
ncbi:hypothetical protein DFH09DRAFT_1073463 [Mycena vulgaris]|nr:hypothetical protein DFH09DRAFT_1073463 [Mycena vulgaris]